MFQWSTFLNLSYGFSIGFDIGFGISFGFGQNERKPIGCILHKSKKRGIEYLHIFTMNNCCFVIIFAYIYLGAKHSLFS